MALDNFELLYHALNSMVNEKVQLHKLKFRSMPSSVMINLEDFACRVGDTNYLYAKLLITG